MLSSDFNLDFSDPKVSPFNLDTPLIPYKCGTKKDFKKNRPVKEVWVKHDDQLNGDLDLPPWAKMEGIRQVLLSDEILSEDNIDGKKDVLYPKLSTDRPIIHLSVRQSYSGWALAYIGRELGFDIKIAYPDTKDYPKNAIEKIKSLGAEPIPMKPNILSIVTSSVANLAKKENYQMMPYAFDHPVYTQFFEDRMVHLLKEHSDKNFDHLVVNAGSGVTPSGLIRGFLKQDEEEKIFPPRSPKKIHIISTSSKRSTRKTLLKHNAYHICKVNIHESKFEFADEMKKKKFETPFPCNENWDKKAWRWLQKNHCTLKGNVLFYNLGGECASKIWSK